jgi:hypothetical protein
MSAQAELVFGPNPTPAELAFWRFHRANPHVLVLLTTLLQEARTKGKRVGIRLLWERLRWALEVETVRGDEEPKLNDHYPPYYARLLMAQDPELQGYFEVRGNAARLALLPTSVSPVIPPDPGGAARLPRGIAAPQLSDTRSTNT